MGYRTLRDLDAVPVLYCERKDRWLPIEEHLNCDYCAGPVYDADDDPVSFICTYTGEVRVFQEGWVDPSEEGYGPPAKPGG
ncbi:MAG: hypothetical protein ACYTEZ_02530 [Planctomycetota bacterium]|jgi:hypothetical protein